MSGQSGILNCWLCCSILLTWLYIKACLEIWEKSDNLSVWYFNIVIYNVCVQVVDLYLFHCTIVFYGSNTCRSKCIFVVLFYILIHFIYAVYGQKGNGTHKYVYIVVSALIFLNFMKKVNFHIQLCLCYMYLSYKVRFWCKRI